MGEEAGYGSEASTKCFNLNNPGCNPGSGIVDQSEV
jgi:hypothetical protein